MQPRVLLVDDDVVLAQRVAQHLRLSGYLVTVERTGVDALARLRRDAFELIVLDFTLPDVHGLEICRSLRRQCNDIPVFMLAERPSDEERVAAFAAGADDCLTKPFSVVELVARSQAMLRRLGFDARRAGRELIVVEELRIDSARREVRLAGHLVGLTPKEFDLLSVLAQNPGRVYSRTQLLDLVWGEDHAGYDHTVHSHINRLRNKIEADPAKPQRILTIRTAGYKFNDPHAGVKRL